MDIESDTQIGADGKRYPSGTAPATVEEAEARAAEARRVEYDAYHADLGAERLAGEPGEEGEEAG